MALQRLRYFDEIDWQGDRDPIASLRLQNSLTDFLLSRTTSGGIYRLLVQQDNTGSHTIPWPDWWHWQGGTAGVLSTAPNAVDLLEVHVLGEIGYATLTKGWALAA